MANPIQLKRSKTAGNTPASLVDGEVAVNIPDRKLYVNDGGGTIRNIDLTSDFEKIGAAQPIGAALAGKLGTSGDASTITLPAPSASGYAAPIRQTIAARYILAQEGGWGASQADNDRVFQNALNYSSNTGNGSVSIELPMGTWPLTTARSISTPKPFSFCGPHRGTSRIVANTGGSPLLSVTQQTIGAQIAVQGIEFVAPAAGVATPLVLSIAGSAQGPSPYYQYSTFLLRDLSFVGSDQNLNYFLNGFDLSNGWNTIIDGVHFTGSVTNRRSAQNGGIFRYCIASQVHNFFTQYAVRALYMPGGATNGQNDEGFAWHSGEAVDVDIGVEAIGTDADPGFFIGPVHINAGKACVRTVYKSQIDVSRSLLYKLVGDSNDFTALDVSKAAYGYINSIQVADSRSSNNGGQFYGLKLTDCVGMTVQGIQAQNWTNAAGSLVYLAGTTDRCALYGVDASQVSGLNPVGLDSTTGNTNRFYGTMPGIVRSLTPNSSTPSVGNDFSGVWVTANTASVNITSFPNGMTGQRFSLFINDAYTTLVHGTPLRLKGGVNVSPPQGATITFCNFGNYFAETSRSF